MTPEYISVEQGTEDWLRLRLGVPTASEFRRAIANRTKTESRARDSYMRTLAGEILTGRAADRVDIENFRRGHAGEPRAVAEYELLTDRRAEPAGFVRLGRLGASPDRLVGISGLLECKDAAPHIQIERLLANAVPEEYVTQVDGQLLVCCDRAWVDFVSHCEGLPPLIVRVHRVDRASELAALRVDLEMFVNELDDLVRRIKEIP